MGLIRYSQKWALALFIILLLVGSGEKASAASSGDGLSPSPLVQGMINQVNQDTLLEELKGLSGEQPVTVGGSSYTFATRFSYADEAIQKATQYAYERFSKNELTVSYFNYSMSGDPDHRNVIAEQPGSTQPSCVYILSAHLDDTVQGGNPYNYAPGADDNASGSVAVLTAADILSQYTFTCTLRYVLFTGEEQGMYGSAAYADYVSGQGEDLRGVLNLDMIAYNSDTNPVIELHTRHSGTTGGSADLVLAQQWVNVVSTYALPLMTEIVKDAEPYSDHASFWGNGYPAVLGIEDYDDFNPYYHKNTDVVANCDMDYYTAIVKSALASAAHLAGPLGVASPGSLSGQITDLTSGLEIEGAVVKAQLGSQVWTASSGTDGTYTMSLWPGDYMVSIQASGYFPRYLNGIIVSANQNTPLDVALVLRSEIASCRFLPLFYTP